MSGTLPQVVRAALDTFVPLGTIAGDPSLATGFLAELGVDVELDEDDLAHLVAAAPAIARIETDLVPVAARLAETGEVSAADALLVIELAADLAASVKALADGGAGSALHLLPPPLDDPATWVDLAGQLLAALVASWLESSAPPLSLPLRLGGVVEQWYDANGRRHRRVDWGLLGDLLTDPLAAVRAAIGWEGDLDVERLLAAARDAALDLGLVVQRGVPPSPVIDLYYPDGIPPTTWPLTVRTPARAGAVGAVGLGILPVPPLGEGRARGIALIDASTIAAGATLALPAPWTLELSGGASSGLAVVFLPGDVPAVVGEPSIDLGVVLRGQPATPWVLLGAGDGLRLELAGLEAEARIAGPTGDLVTTFRLAATGDGLSLVLPAGSGDNFLAAVLGPSIDVGAALDLSWTSQGGLTLRGSPTLGLAIPLGLTLGPLQLEELDVDLSLGEATRLDLRLLLGAQIGPFQAAVDGLGLGIGITVDPDGDGAVGPFDLALDFLPPTRIGFAIDGGAVSGGGFIEIDPAIGRYSGALSLDVVSIGIDAIVVVDTQLPGDPDGWALFASLAASFPGIPLGFGFTLLGVGGLLALNRSLDEEALAAGLRSGVIDSLLFPDDPLGDSAEIVARIDEYFPLLAGNTVVGPVIEIGWGSPTLITAQLGIVISLPEGLIAVMGSVAALLPTPDAPLLTLHMDALGVIDLAGGTFSLTASLYDSRLLQTIDLSGDMAMYLQATSQPYFLLSVGGYHPGFEPPSLVPAPMHDLRRMQAAIKIASTVEVTVQSYFAVTSNSVQFGASVNVEASVEIWPTTYTAKGWFGFDVLLVFSPFKIVASMSAGVGIYAGNKELMGVQLSLTLEGPKPWFAAGNASFRFFGIKVDFDLEVGSKAAGQPKPIVHPRQDVLDALRSPSSWSEAAAVDGQAAGITYAADGLDGDQVWVRPDHQVTCRQSVAPLNRTLEIVGQAVPADSENLLTVTGAGFGTAGVEAEWDLADDWFAPAQFEQLSKTDKLARSSFEPMTAGVTFGAPEARITALPDELCTEVETVYEDGYWPSDESLAHSVRTGAAGLGLRQATAPVTPRFTVAPTAYTVVRPTDAAEAVVVLRDAGYRGGGVSQHDALSARNHAVAGDDGQAARTVVVPVSALEAVS